MKQYYVSFEYLGNKEYEYKPYKSWFIYSSGNNKLTKEDIMSINVNAAISAMEEQNIEHENINDATDIVILCIQELVSNG